MGTKKKMPVDNAVENVNNFCMGSLQAKLRSTDHYGGNG